MHNNVKIFCESIKLHFPHFFVGVNILDCGCLDINGNNRYLFKNSIYTGIDIVDGPNVDFITRVHEFKPDRLFDVVISTEMLEHDRYYEESLKGMFKLTRSGGLMLFTAAGEGRLEHGTRDHNPLDSPLTHDYYRNLTAAMIVGSLPLGRFSWFEISYSDTDIRFAGIKR